MLQACPHADEAGARRGGGSHGEANGLFGRSEALRAEPILTRTLSRAQKRDRSFVSQRHYWIDRRRLARWEVSCKHGDADQEERYQGKCKGIVRLYAI